MKITEQAQVELKKASIVLINRVPEFMFTAHKVAVAHPYKWTLPRI